MKKYLGLTVAVTLLLFASCKEKGFKAGFTGWIPISDDISTINVLSVDEKINGKTENSVTISGNLHNYEEIPFTEYGFYSNIPFTGTYGTFDEPSLEAVKTMKSFSFKALGDGNRYFVRLPTLETIEGDHWLNVFPTVKDEIITVTVRVPEDLVRLGWSGKNVEFIQDNIFIFQVQVVDPEIPYRLKFWDIRFYR